MSGRYLVVGVGNVLLKDEGIGVYAARWLESNYRFNPEVEIIDGATLGFRLMQYFQEYDKVLLIDVVSIKDTTGSLYRLPAEEMMGLGSYRQSAHEVEVVEMLEICSLLDKMADVVVFGIVPEDIDTMQFGLTDSMVEAFPALCDAVLTEIKNDGITAQKTAEEVSLQRVMDEIQGLDRSPI